MKRTPQQEAEYAIAYGSRDDLKSDEARAVYDQLAAARAVPRLVRSQAAPPPARKRVPRVIFVRFCTAILVLAAGQSIEAVTGSHTALCNSAIGQLAQGFSSGAYADCSVWTGVHTFGEFVLWLGVIGTVGLGLMFGLALREARSS